MAAPTVQVVAQDGARPGQRILRVSGPVSMETAPVFLKALRSETAPVVLLEFSGVPFIDSAGIGALIQSYVRFTNEKRRLALLGINERVRAVLDITRVHKFLPIFASQEEATAKFGQTTPP